jgi:hypothetical protein
MKSLGRLGAQNRINKMKTNIMFRRGIEKISRRFIMKGIKIMALKNFRTDQI